MKHSKSKFVWDARSMTLVSGKAPKRDGVLYKGEDTNGKKMELVGYDGDVVCYWGWSDPPSGHWADVDKVT